MSENPQVRRVQGRMERSTRALLRDLRVSVEREPIAAGLLSMAIRCDEAPASVGPAAHREYRQALAELHEHVARRSPVPQPAPAEEGEGGGRPAAEVVDIVDRLKRPAR